MQKIVLATGNAGKLKELRALLADQPFEILSQKDLDVSDADETGLSFIENAILKARHCDHIVVHYRWPRALCVCWRWCAMPMTHCHSSVRVSGKARFLMRHKVIRVLVTIHFSGYRLMV